MYYFFRLLGDSVPSQVGPPLRICTVVQLWLLSIQAVRFEPDRMHKVVIMLPMRFIMRLIFLADMAMFCDKMCMLSFVDQTYFCFILNINFVFLQLQPSVVFHRPS